MERKRAAHLGPERRRPMVLDAACSLFIERGYAATSVEAIAEAAGITRSVVYDCYPGKRELFEALFEREQSRLMEHLLAAVPADPAFDDPEQLLRAGFTGFLTAAAASPESWRLVYSQHPHPKIAGTLTTGRQIITGMMQGLAAATLAAQGIADPDDRTATMLAYLLVGQAEASVRLMLDHPGVWEPNDLGALLGRLTAHSLGRLTR